jgi:hypothetical protein
MSPERSGKTHVAAWLAGIILAFPIFYRLSVPPLDCAAYFHSRHDMYYWRPDWLKTYEAPARWMGEWPPLAKAFHPYDIWVRHRMYLIDPGFGADPYFF